MKCYSISKKRSFLYFINTEIKVTALKSKCVLVHAFKRDAKMELDIVLMGERKENAGIHQNLMPIVLLVRRGGNKKYISRVCYCSWDGGKL